jgi:hypothetical protein
MGRRAARQVRATSGFSSLPATSTAAVLRLSSIRPMQGSCSRARSEWRDRRNPHLCARSAEGVAVQGEDEGEREPGSPGNAGAAPLLTSCSSCKQLHRPEQPLEFNPICAACVRAKR